MDSKSDTNVDDTRAVEVGVISHEGREYTAGGFAIDTERGRLVAYVTARTGQYLDGSASTHYLTTWGGEWIADLVWTSTIRVRAFGGPVKLQCYRTLTPIAGYHWYGRGLGVGMILKMCRGRKADARKR